MKLSRRLEILRYIMLNHELSQAEQRLCWYLLLERMNDETSKCDPSTRTLAKHLNLNLGTIHRARQHLKELGILTWVTAPKQSHQNASYRFNKGFDCAHAVAQNENLQSPLTAHTQSPLTAHTQSPLTAHTQSPLTAHTQSPQTTFYAKFGSPELDYWDAFLRKTTGNTAPRDRRGGWLFPSQWPKENVQ